MVAAALGGEGKTSLSIHLATSLARAGRRSLLVDCDLRRPTAHHPFNRPQGPGFCELLRGEINLAEAVRPTDIPGLYVITAGYCDQLAIESLSQAIVPTVFARLRDQFTFVIVDSAPVLPVADSLEIGQHVDAVVFSVLRDVSRLPSIHAAYERLRALRIRMLGAVVAGTRGEVYGYSGRYAYGERVSQASSALPRMEEPDPPVTA